MRELDDFGLAYLHLMKPDASDLKADPGAIPHGGHVPPDAAPRTALTANGGYNQNRAEDTLRTGIADTVSSGQLFIANPDLPERFRRQASLNPPDPSTYYGEGLQGCTYYTTLGGAGSWTPAPVSRVPAAAAACARTR